MNNWEKAFYFASGFLVCTVVLLLFKFTWDWTVKLTDLLQLILAILIGYKIQHYTTFKYNQSRVSIQHIERRIADVEKELKSLNSFLEESFVSSKVLTDKILESKRDFSNNIHLLEKSIKLMGMTCTSVDLLKELRGKYIDVITGGKFPTEIYSIETYTKAKQFQLKIMETLLAITVEVNSDN